MGQLDSCVLRLLALSEGASVSVSSIGGGMSSASASKITAKWPDGEVKEWFMKTATGKMAEVMFRGEHHSLNAISSTVPSMCPRSLGHGAFEDSPNKHFLVTEFIDMSGRSTTDPTPSDSKPLSLGKKFAILHSTPAPTHPELGYDKPMFGFPCETCCGDTIQPNPLTASWAEFYSEHRLGFILTECERNNGKDNELRRAVERTRNEVVPRLIGDGPASRFNGGKPLVPSVVHGDCWSGNANRGTLASGVTGGRIEDLVFDPSASYSHSEFDAGIMKMFGGFGPSFWSDYWKEMEKRGKNKTEPVDEYADRIELYELYHHLNHQALFGGGYRSGAMRIMKALLRRYGDESKA